MTSKGKKIWDSPEGASLMDAMLGEKPLSQQDVETKNRLIESSKEARQLSGQTRGHPGSSRPVSSQPKPDTSTISRMLTPSELQQLRQSGREADAYLQKVFPNVKVA